METTAFTPPAGVLNIAHRGARSLAPENTLAAAQKALQSGADMWELDVAMTADGELILVHDDTLARTSDVGRVFPGRMPGPVHTLTLPEIRRLDFGSWFVAEDPFGQIAAGQVLPEDTAAYAGEPAPTLQQALAFTRDNQWQVNVEIKDLSGTPGHAVVVEKVVALIEAMGMAGQVLVSSFNHTYLARVKAANRQIATGALVTDAAPDPAALLKSLDAQAYHPFVLSVDAGVIGNLRRQGFAVYVWTVNDEAAMQSLIRAGVSGIITDFPQRLHSLLG